MKRYNPIEFRYGELVLADTVECEIGDYYRVSDVDDEINTLKSEIELKDKEIAVLKDKLAAIVSGDIGVLPYDHDYFGGADKHKNTKDKEMDIIEAARKAKRKKKFVFNSDMPQIWPLIPEGSKVIVTYEW